jgi:hypothetical protein
VANDGDVANILGPDRTHVSTYCQRFIASRTSLKSTFATAAANLQATVSVDAGKDALS